MPNSRLVLTVALMTVAAALRRLAVPSARSECSS